MDSTKTFLYHAHATALGGAIRRPFTESLEAQAGASLPEVGGYGAAHAENFNYRNMVFFKNAYTQVSGTYNEADQTYNTLVSTVVEGLNVLEVVMADRIVARLATQRRLDEPETRVVATGSQFENLRIAGFPVDLELDTDLFCQHDTYAGFKNRFKQDPAFAQQARERFLWGNIDKTAPEFLKQRYNWHKQAETLLDANGMVPCTLLKRQKCECPELRSYGHVLKVPQFGTIHIGELMFSQHKRRLTMLRLELGSPTDGSIDIGGIEGNGITVP